MRHMEASVSHPSSLPLKHKSTAQGSGPSLVSMAYATTQPYAKTICISRWRGTMVISSKKRASTMTLKRFSSMKIYFHSLTPSTSSLNRRWTQAITTSAFCSWTKNSNRNVQANAPTFRPRTLLATRRMLKSMPSLKIGMKVTKKTLMSVVLPMSSNPTSIPISSWNQSCCSCFQVLKRSLLPRVTT